MARQIEMTARDAFDAVVDINETIEMLKEKNNGTTPDKTLCQATRLLLDYRDLLSDALEDTHIFKPNLDKTLYSML